MPRIGINSVIDIAVCAAAIYVLIVWIKETRAWSLFKGVMVLIVVAVLSYLFDLYAVFWIISSAFSVGVIALIIIFQPEMRRALEQLGKSRFALSGDAGPRRLDDRTADEIVAAAFAMSKAKTGALIVIEREVPLGDFEAAGVSLDAIVSTRLLMNIFVNKTPLHDGAVVIRNNRIAAAACILPLTAVEVSDNMGTRHRAAIGASEVSDATVVVVSEETGIVSVAQSGRLQRRLNEAQLLEMITKDAKLSGLSTEILHRSFWRGLFSGGSGSEGDK
jgi:diadenylate cyclase